MDLYVSVVEKLFDLKPDEIKLLKESERCKNCGHLVVLHDLYDMEYCHVENCDCFSFSS